jgi:hypothetical protein
MKTILRQRNVTPPDGIDPKVRDWMIDTNAQAADERRDLEDEFSKIGKVARWTPVLTFAVPGDLAVSYTTNMGDLIRTRDGIIAQFRIITSAFTYTTASGVLAITGLPYTASTLSADSAMGWVGGGLVFQGITKANFTQFVPQIMAGSSSILIVASGSAQVPANLTTTDVPSGGSVVLAASLSFRIRS